MREDKRENMYTLYVKILFVKIAKNVLNIDIVFGTACCCFNKQLDYNDDHSFSLSSLL